MDPSADGFDDLLRELEMNSGTPAAPGATQPNDDGAVLDLFAQLDAAPGGQLIVPPALVGQASSSVLSAGPQPSGSVLSAGPQPGSPGDQAEDDDEEEDEDPELARELERMIEQQRQAAAAGATDAESADAVAAVDATAPAANVAGLARAAAEDAPGGAIPSEEPATSGPNGPGDGDDEAAAANWLGQHQLDSELDARMRAAAEAALAAVQASMAPAEDAFVAPAAPGGLAAPQAPAPGPSPAEVAAPPPDKAKRSRPNDQQPAQKRERVLYVSGLPPDVSLVEVADTFSRYGILDVDAEEIAAHIRRVATGGIYDSDDEEDTQDPSDPSRYWELSRGPRPLVRFYRDEAGQLKGDGTVAYFRPESVPLAIDMLDGFPLRPDRPPGQNFPLSVRRAVFSPQSGDKSREPAAKRSRQQASRPAGADAPELSAKEQEKARREELKRRMMTRAKYEFLEGRLNWDSERDAAARANADCRLVYLENMFTKQEIEEDVGLLVDLKEDILEECETFGVVTSITIYDLHPKGACTIRFEQPESAAECGACTIRFEQPESAAECVRALNGRFFGGRTVKAVLFNGRLRRLAKYRSAADQDPAPEEPETGGGPGSSLADPFGGSDDSDDEDYARHMAAVMASSRNGPGRDRSTGHRRQEDEDDDFDDFYLNFGKNQAVDDYARHMAAVMASSRNGPGRDRSTGHRRQEDEDDDFDDFYLNFGKNQAVDVSDD
ncbi:hypothetical protein H696_00368 [Fonticula alba]|uniref:RRM domain-containing protein n=1 Tax=Fonticula alba TaxID=691883 RepID=A0A058ZEJ2_FONAL|nr:hypothetical protein H696_00368 [Fonticula alba]KCV72789.1 hypothetical protein H696_00368 [Fonticula alba]|eukprot:XP_009492490.1 hypothetical protein H696_00368 [Fonticula alba]